MSPWELVALYLIAPVLAIGVWLNNHLETDGARVPEFEAWCRLVRPLLFALQSSPSGARRIAEELRAAIGPRRQVEHRTGRYPWTRCVFTVAIELDEAEGIVRCRVERSTVRRVRAHHPDIAALADRVVSESSDLRAVWLHTELRDGDEARGEARRGRGWLASAPVRTPGPKSNGASHKLGAFELTADTPSWAAPSP